MVVLRATRRVLAKLPKATAIETPSDTALGDWYANQVMVGRHPLLLMISSRSLLPILEPARGVRQLPDRLPELVRRRLAAIDLPEDVVEAEVARMSPVRIDRTQDRSVVGILTEFAFMVQSYLRSLDDRGLRAAEADLARTPCFASRPQSETVWPTDKTQELLAGKWGS